MSASKFERIIAGVPENISHEELLELQAFCSARNYPLEQWISASLALYKVNPDLCYQFLCYLDRNELNKPIYNDYIHQGSKIIIYNNLTGLVLAKATNEASQEESKRLLSEATRFFNSSEKVRMAVDKSIALNRALLHYYGGQVTKALSFVSRTHEEINKTGQGKHLLTTTLLILAQINFVKKNYAKALELYKKCLQISKNLPSKARIGMGYSFFYLGKYELARACFQRILKLDSTCVEAYIGIGIVHQKSQNYAEYFKYMTYAYKLKKDHPLVLLHLTQHFILKGQLQKSFDFSQRGLEALERYPKFFKIQQNSRNDYQQMKARFNNIIGQIHHINSNYTEAIKYFSLASGKGLIFNQISLAQVYINANSQNYLEAKKLLDDAYKQLDGKDTRLLNDSYKLMAYLKSKVPPNSKDEKGADFYYSQSLKFNRHDFQVKIEFAGVLVETNKSKALRLLEEAEKIQQNSIKEIKPELQNNIAVLQLQNGSSQNAQKRLNKIIKTVDSYETENQEQQIKKNSLQIICRFNLAICMERDTKWDSARKLYEQIISLNKYHLDTYIRLAHVQLQLGNYSAMKSMLEQSQKVCSDNKRILRLERILNAKAYMQHISGSSHEAKQTLKLLGKNKDIYTQVFELCINYQNIMRKGVQMANLKDFLRPNRQFCYKYCKEDHHATFAYMLLAIILLVDKKFTKNQGIEFFNNLKQFSSDEIPSILFNMGLFLMNYDDYENSNTILNTFKDKIGINCHADEIISLNYLLENQFSKSESYIKRNIMRDPTNLKYRMQLAYVTERRCLKYYEKNDFTTTGVTCNIHHLKKCSDIYEKFFHINMSDYLKGIEILQYKQRIRAIYMKIKLACEERKFYVKSYLDSYEKVLKELEIVEGQRIEADKKNQEKILNQQRQRQLQKLLEQEEESEDEEQKEKRQIERKKKRALEIARKRQAQMDINWNELKEKQQQIDKQKNSRKRNTSSKPSAPRNRREKPKEKSQSSFDQLPNLDNSEPQIEYSEQQQQQEPKKRHKHEKKQKKNRKRQREVSDNQLEQQSRSKGKSDKQPENDQNDDLLKNYLID